MIPNLIHPIPIRIEPSEPETTGLLDPDAREPVLGVRGGASWTIDAQIAYDLRNPPSFEIGGVRITATGFVVVRTADLAARSKTISCGDRIASIGGTTTDLYVLGTTPRAHYTDQGGATLLRCYFSDRKPVRG